MAYQLVYYVTDVDYLLHKEKPVKPEIIFEKASRAAEYMTELVDLYAQNGVTGITFQIKNVISQAKYGADAVIDD